MLYDIRGMNEECGVFGVFNHHEASHLAYYGLHSLQHRGQEGTGIVTTDGERLHAKRGLGLVAEVFDELSLDALTGHHAIGHVRYSTAGGNTLENVQPLHFKSLTGDLAMAHNGNLVNANELKHMLEAEGAIFQTTSDTEVVAHLIKRSRGNSLKERISDSLARLVGAFAFLFLTEDALYVGVDVHGLRPLSLGKTEDGAFVFASETCAFDVVGATYVRDVEPGELLMITKDGIVSERYSEAAVRAMCSMEYIYFSRPDSIIDGINVHTARKAMGKKMFNEAPVEADVVTGVPDSSISAAIGYAEASGIPYEMGLIKNRYVGRTFIQPSQELRERGVKMKLSALRGVVNGKRVIMVDDSIVRGTTSRRIVKLLREAGATEVHVRITSPPIKHPCYYGIDTSSKDELIAATKSIEEIKQEIGADSLAFLTLDGTVEAIGRPFEGNLRGQCAACFTGLYPTELAELVTETKA
ncbi:amidophosphoribosyltransferase [Exiguobacterium sp. SH1S21]|uniref:amidophosphoribosyltransferase n=1 Tax=Exiguobacterium sp. SH1S21 TaxID=2510953 RepID=UPI00103FCB9E|nr:amidophosphoribosyltransferase [Exiguobacterium sp. SH1S21]TCI53401.1 amidophosphoribosyltransferase [Exiguobacterium sp. SH1S21]